MSTISGSPTIHGATASTLTNQEIAADLASRLGSEKVLSRLIERTAKAGDASIYRLTPRVVVQPETEEDIQAILRYCCETGLHLTFRAAGTSLSGQAVTDGILVDISPYWKKIRVLNEARQVAIEPGVIAAHVNAFIAPYHVKIGPDPASIGACMMGGVAANNASGMCCGVQFNSYHTLSALRFILPDGYQVNTAQPDADDRLRTDRPQLHQGLLQIRDALRANPQTAARVARKFAIKNTTGYSMNAFLDYDKPVDILAHLLIGSEGTLAFISEITLDTLPDKPVKATALVYFQELTDAGRAVAPLEQAGAAVLEIMDRASMLSVVDDMEYPFTIAPLDPTQPPVITTSSTLPIIHSNCAALLIEFQEENESDILQRLDAALAILNQYPLLTPPTFTRDPRLQADYWHMRKGLFPSVGGMRQIGTAVIIEDVCVEPHYLAEAITDIQALFVRHHFPDAIIFGHARNGNIHFVICTDFADPQQVQRYSDLMDELTDVIVRKYDGSLKAEHGTGRNIAPFVEKEWGEEVTTLMWQVKHLIDPGMNLNPGVLLTTDPQAHLKDLKVMPAVSPIVDKCIECGFCEPRCPSRDLTTTPRQRIALLREMQRLESLGDSESLTERAALWDEYDYAGKETCAADGMCATACPVKINTGDMIKSLRAAEHPALARKIAAIMARNFSLLTAGARFGLGIIQYGGAPALWASRLVMGAANKLSKGKIPRLPQQVPLPAPAARLPEPQPGHSDKKVVYFATCLTRSMGAIPDEPSAVSVPQAVVAVAEKCGWQIIWPQGISSSCCGQPFFSKGFNDAGLVATRNLIDKLWDASEQGKWPIICDTSPCTGQLHHCDAYLTGDHLARWKKLRIFDIINWLAHDVLPSRTDWPMLDRRVILHPTCTVMKNGWTGDLKLVAQTFSSNVEVPVLAECCGFAGDRGLLYPELTLSATRPEASEVRRKTHMQPMAPGDPCAATPIAQACQTDSCEYRYYSTCRTCEMGMAATTGKPYAGIIQLVYDALVAKR